MNAFHLDICLLPTIQGIRRYQEQSLQPQKSWNHTIGWQNDIPLVLIKSKRNKCLILSRMQTSLKNGWSDIINPYNCYVSILPNSYYGERGLILFTSNSLGIYLAAKHMKQICLFCMCIVVVCLEKLLCLILWYIMESYLLFLIGSSLILTRLHSLEFITLLVNLHAEYWLE